MGLIKQIWLDVGWLFALLTTFAVPFALDTYGRLTYFTSLLFWVIPIAYLLPVFRSITAGGRGRRRRAMRASVITLVIFGAALDFLVGHITFRFESCETYVYCLSGPGGKVPIEELLFYAFGPAAMVLVYACADELWLKLYNPPDDLLDMKLIALSRGWLLFGVAVGILLWVIWRINGTFPTYLAFLAGLGLLPTLFLYDTVRHFMNWPAFAVTVLYVIVTSIVWEVTLALPRGWWGFEPSAMVGIDVDAWSSSKSRFPIEEVGVWLAAPFFTLLTYEFAKAFYHHPLSSKSALLGSRESGRGRMAPATEAKIWSNER
jgi:hypothetical protein